MGHMIVMRVHRHTVVVGQLHVVLGITIISAINYWYALFRNRNLPVYRLSSTGRSKSWLLWWIWPTELLQQRIRRLAKLRLWVGLHARKKEKSIRKKFPLYPRTFGKE